MSARDYYVVGGEFADTGFTRPAPGASLETHGPMTEREAHDLWRKLTGQTVDNAMVRYFVENRVAEQPVYVVGGEYAGTDFARLAAKGAVEVLGPFTAAEALNQWRARTAATVDSCLHRYDLVGAAELDGFVARIAG